MRRVARHLEHDVEAQALRDALDAKAPAFPVFLRVMCRQNVYPNHRTDDYFVQKLLGEEIAVSPPETLAARLREGF